MQTFIIRRRSVWESEAEWQCGMARSRRVCREQMGEKLRWMRSYLVREADGRFGSVCLCRARDANAIREHAVRSDMPVDALHALSAAVTTQPATAIARRAA